MNALCSYSFSLNIEGRRRSSNVVDERNKPMVYDSVDDLLEQIKENDRYKVKSITPEKRKFIKFLESKKINPVYYESLWFLKNEIELKKATHFSIIDKGSSNLLENLSPEQGFKMILFLDDASSLSKTQDGRLTLDGFYKAIGKAQKTSSLDDYKPTEIDPKYLCEMSAVVKNFFAKEKGFVLPCEGPIPQPRPKYKNDYKSEQKAQFVN